MRRDPRKYLEDILQCILEIELTVGGLSFETYQQVFLLRRGCERDFIIIAEALSHIGQISPELHSRVDHVRQIANFRNVIVHGYMYVDDAYVWKVIQESVPILKQQIEAWAAELDATHHP
jgi:uncharacterized protein with HEPN domain